MVSQITRGIKNISIDYFEGTYFKITKYTLPLAGNDKNHSKDSVQLTSRHWEIYDSLNNIEIVDGEGVIGKKPVLKPGELHTYSSGCLLTSHTVL
jgi:ApaG protein